MRFSKEAPAIVYAAPGTKVIVLGAVLAFAAACFYLLGVLVERLLVPVAEDVTRVHLLSGNLSAVALVTLSVGMLSIAVGVVWLLRLPEPERLKVRVRSGIFDSRYGNPLHLREGEVLPHVTCEETDEGRFELTVSASSSTVEEIAKLAPSISSRLCGRFSRYAVVLSEADEACNRVTFHIEDVTVHREIVAGSVSELQPPSAYALRVQDGTSIDLRTSGSMLVAGKTRSGKTTGIISLVLQALLVGPDGYGSRVLVIDPKRAELSRLPHVATLDEDGNARGILAALGSFAETITERQRVLNELSAETGDAVHWWDAGFHVSLLFIDEYVALRTVLPKRASKEDPDYCLAAFDGLIKRIVTMGASAGCYAIISIAEASVEEGGLPSMIRSACSTRILFRPTLDEARLIWGSDRLKDFAVSRTYGPGDAWFSSTDGEHDRIGFVHFPVMRFPVYRELGRLLELYVD